VACSNKEKYYIRVIANGHSPPSYNSKHVDSDQDINGEGDQQEAGKVQAHEGENGQTEAILKRKLFTSRFEGE